MHAWWEKRHHLKEQTLMPEQLFGAGQQNAAFCPDWTVTNEVQPLPRVCIWQQPVRYSLFTSVSNYWVHQKQQGQALPMRMRTNK